MDAHDWWVVLWPIGTSIVTAWGAFRFLPEKWLENRFARQLETYRATEQQALARLQSEINTMFDRTVKQSVAQLELAIETLEEDDAQQTAARSPVFADLVEQALEARKPARRQLPDHLPREDVIHPTPCTCPACGSALRKIGEDVTETLDYVPARFKTIRHIRAKFACRACDTVVQAPASHHAIARGRAGPGLLAHIMVSKYDDHLPLYRQAEIFAREKLTLEISTLSGWVGATAAALQPLTDALAAEIRASDTLHADDTPLDRAHAVL
jgi:transposase